jgi:hypothetical protein
MTNTDKIPWNTSTYYNIAKFLSQSSPYITKKQLDKKVLPLIIKDTQTLGKTPDATLCRVLQFLRDLQLIEFVDNKGNYKFKNDVAKKDANLLLSSKGGSKGEKRVALQLDKVATIFKDINFKYIREAKFPDLKDKSYLRWDFAIEAFGTFIFIEFDGAQHQIPIQHFGGLEGHKLLLKHDKQKNDWAEQKKYQIKRFTKSDSNDEIYKQILACLENIKI